MEIKVEKITDESLMQWAAGLTIDSTTDISLNKMYKCEHSPMRTQMFKVEMRDIPTFVSVHLVRHKIGVEHFVKSNREDRCGKGKPTPDRYTPVNHGMFLNADALITMARKRLCGKASATTQIVMQLIKDKVWLVDPALAIRMRPECLYRGEVCHEDKPCGFLERRNKENGF